MSHDYYITPEEYERAAAIGIDGQTLDRRVRLLGWKKERALSTPIRKQVPRGHYASWAEVAKGNGIMYASFMTRIRNGWTEEKAATTPLQSPEEARQNALRGTEYVRKIPREYIEKAARNGISHASLHNRIKNLGWDMERAATEPIWSPQQRGRLGAQRLREREGDWAAQIFGKQG